MPDKDDLQGRLIKAEQKLAEAEQELAEAEANGESQKVISMCRKNVGYQQQRVTTLRNRIEKGK